MINSRSGEDAVDPRVLHHGERGLKLSGPTPPTPRVASTVRPLITLAKSDQMPGGDVVRLGIQTGSATIAKGAVEALSKSDLLKPDVAELDALLDHWTKCGSRCNRCAIDFAGNFCPKCRLGIPTPRAGLVRTLIDRHHLSEDRLLHLCADYDSDVTKAASAALAKIAVGNAELFQRILSAVNTGQAPICILNDALTLPASSLRPHSNLACALANSPTRSSAFCASFTPSGWTDTGAASNSQGLWSHRSRSSGSNSGSPLATVSAS